MLLNKKRIDLQANTCSNAVIYYLKLSLKSIPTNVEFYLDKSEMIKIFLHKYVINCHLQLPVRYLKLFHDIVISMIDKFFLTFH